jgi:putative transposase
MSRLRRPFLSDGFFFLTVKLLPDRSPLAARDFAALARSLCTSRTNHRFLLTAWVFLPDHWHAIVGAHYPLTISLVMKSIKVSSMNVINRQHRQSGELWQGRFFDHALRTVRDHSDTVEYIHLNPVRRGLVPAPEDWPWSSASEYSGMGREEQRQRCGLTVDRVRLPADPNARI